MGSERKARLRAIILAMTEPSHLFRRLFVVVSCVLCFRTIKTRSTASCPPRL